MKLYHGSRCNTLHENKLNAIDGVFGNSLFFTDEINTAESFGSNLYQVELNEDDILTQNNLSTQYYEEAYNAFKVIADDQFLNAASNEDDLNKAFDLVIEDDVTLDDDEIALFTESDEYGSVYATAKWLIQKIRVDIAIKLGFRGIEMSDETGTSYLVNQPILKKVS